MGVPLVGYTVQLSDSSFVGYDRHGDDEILRVEFGDAFMCRWWNVEEAASYAEAYCGTVRVEVDGELV